MGETLKGWTRSLQSGSPLFYLGSAGGRVGTGLCLGAEGDHRDCQDILPAWTRLQLKGAASSPWACAGVGAIGAAAS
jgi:hypothetical protein